jgi:hypothetical protein
MTAEEINQYLINKGDIDGMITVKQIGNIITHGYFFMEDQSRYLIAQNKWQFSVQGKLLTMLNGEDVISIDYQIN